MSHYHADLIVSAFGGTMLTPTQDPGLPYGVKANDIGGPHPKIDPDDMIDRVAREVSRNATEIAEMLIEGDSMVAEFLNDLYAECTE